MVNIKSLRAKVYQYVKKNYNTNPEYLWAKFPSYAVFRHNANKKWYAIIMNIPFSKLGIEKDERVDILNVKLSDQFLYDILIQQKGFFKAYHMSRGNWITILLDGSVSFGQVCKLIDESFIAINAKKKHYK